ncbi:unnamed protein product [Calypogeia fissa]
MARPPYCPATSISPKIWWAAKETVQVMNTIMLKYPIIMAPLILLLGSDLLMSDQSKPKRQPSGTPQEKSSQGTIGRVKLTLHIDKPQLLAPKIWWTLKETVQIINTTMLKYPIFAPCILLMGSPVEQPRKQMTRPARKKWELPSSRQEQANKEGHHLQEALISPLHAIHHVSVDNAGCNCHKAKLLGNLEPHSDLLISV